MRCNTGHLTKTPELPGFREGPVSSPIQGVPVGVIGWQDIEIGPGPDRLSNSMPHPNWSNIAVMGAGAIGCYFGGMLARGGAKVTLIARRKHVEAINTSGLLLQSLDFQDRVPVTATDDAAAVGNAALILFCVKSTDTDDAAQQMAPHVAADAVILSLQNGVDNTERIQRHVKNRVIPVLVYAAAQMSAPGHVQHTGGGYLVMGPSPESGEITALFASAQVPVRISETIEADLWTKLLLNCAYNAVSALGAAPYSRMVAMAEIREVMRDVVNEVLQVARAKGIGLPENIIEATFKLAEAMPQTISSTAQDIQNGKRTEIGHLNGFVVREAEALGIPAPVNRTLNALIKLREQSRAD